MNHLSERREDGPTQPILTKYPSSAFGKQQRCFSSSSYKTFPFVEYSCHCDAVYCFACRQFPSKSGHAESTFTDKGFRNWKKLGEILGKHSKSDSHVESMSYWKAWQASQKSGSVVFQVDRHTDKVITKNREVVSTLARISLLCGRQGLALRGHRESKSSDTGNKGNFLSIVDFTKLESTNFEENLSSLPKNANYLSKDSQYELLQSAAAVILDKICSEIKRAPCYSVIADEARDISRMEQMSICVRYVQDGEICERFLQFVDTHPFDAASLCDEIAKCLVDNGFELI